MGQVTKKGTNEVEMQPSEQKVPRKSHGCSHDVPPYPRQNIWLGDFPRTKQNVGKVVPRRGHPEVRIINAL